MVAGTPIGLLLTLTEAGAAVPAPSPGGGAGFVVATFTRKKYRELLRAIEREKKKAELPEAREAAVALKAAAEELSITPYNEWVSEVEALLAELRALRVATISAGVAAARASVIQQEVIRLQQEIEEDDDEEMLLSGGWL